MLTCSPKRLLTLFLNISISVVWAGFAASEEIHTAEQPLPAEEAAATMQVPEGFHVSLFAGEPHVQQPIGFCIDDRGRLWVAEAYNYPVHGTKAGDRIIILEDQDGDGKFDQRTVFYDKLNYVTGIEVGFGGAWVMSPPYFYFIPDKDGDDKPDGPPEVLLDGFGNHANSHNLANGFSWGPDGWLYGTHGRTNWSMIGKPGTPEAERVRFDGGVYRYHPVRHVWEPFADGTTNPWGIDFDDYGQGFVCNCVNPHLFHVIQGAHYEPWRNRASSRYAYQRIDTIADHLHYTGGGDVRAGLGSGEEVEAGGGHAHCGTMIYLGDSWPEKYRNTVFMNNIHGRRINNDLLRREGSGYVATHGKDLMVAKDPWYMGVTLRYGPDGSVYASDWSDTGECHSVRNTRRATGRIYKISYGNKKSEPVDLAAMTDEQLVKLQLHKNDWYVQHARRILQERFAAGQDLSKVVKQLLAMYAEEKYVPKKLRLFWALFVLDGLNEKILLASTEHESEYVRAWAVRLLTDQPKISEEALQRFEDLAGQDPSSFVRLHLASALQTLPLEDRWEIATELSNHAENAEDQNLPLMIWYAVEPLVEEDLDRFIALAGKAKIPLVRQFIARRAASFGDAEKALPLLVKMLADSKDDAVQADVLVGMLQGLEGQRSAKLPSEWPDVYQTLLKSSDQETRQHATQLALLFDDPVALQTMQLQATDVKADAADRLWAIEALVNKKPKELGELLIGLVEDPVVCGACVKGLAVCNDPSTAKLLLEKYKDFNPATRQDVINTLTSRATWAKELLAGVKTGWIPRGELTAFAARQIENLNDESLTKELRSVWGEVRTTSAEKKKLIAGYKRIFTPEALEHADRAAGRTLFNKTCANCHKLFDAGGKIGPDITGSQRQNLDYLLENLFDPSAAVAKDYQMQVFATESGRVLTGLVIAETEKTITIQTPTEQVVLPLSEIEERSESKLSMMPDGLLKQLSPQQLLDLVAYLTGSTQVELEPSQR